MDNLERTNARVTGASSGIGQACRIVAPRRLFLRNSGAAVLSGAAVALLGRAALADAATTPQANPHDSAPTQFRAVGDARLAYRKFGKEGAPPLVCLQHFTGRMDNWDPIHTNRLAQDRPVVLVDYRGVGRSSGETPDSVPGMGRDIIAFIRTLAPGRWTSSGSLSGAWSPSRSLWMHHSLSGGSFSRAPVRRVAKAWLRSRRRCKKSIVGQRYGGQRMLELFFSPTATSQAAGKAWLARIAARQVDREPPSSPQVAAAQLAG